MTSGRRWSLGPSLRRAEGAATSPPVPRGSPGRLARTLDRGGAPGGSPRECASASRDPRPRDDTAPARTRGRRDRAPGRGPRRSRGRGGCGSSRRPCARGDQLGLQRLRPPELTDAGHHPVQPSENGDGPSHGQESLPLGQIVGRHQEIVAPAPETEASVEGPGGERRAACRLGCPRARHGQKQGGCRYHGSVARRPWHRARARRRRAEAPTPRPASQAGEEPRLPTGGLPT